MADTSVTKVQSKHSPHGEMGQKYLAAGTHIAMRLWENEQPGEAKPLTARDYETVGYVVAGRAELLIENQELLLEPGDSWAVPKGAAHTYKILEPFTAVEATSPPAFAQGRDRVEPADKRAVDDRPGRKPAKAPRASPSSRSASGSTPNAGETSG